jgi:hypothetical protein
VEIAAASKSGGRIGDHVLQFGPEDVHLLGFNPNSHLVPSDL